MFSYQHPHPAVTTDIVLFTVHDDALRVLLIKRAEEPYLGKWALPGGFVDINEDLETAARRELEEETGVTGVELKQLYTFGAVNRDPRERVITVAYFARLPSDQLQVRAATDAEAVEWFRLDQLPELAFDHAEILEMARERVVAEPD